MTIKWSWIVIFLLGVCAGGAGTYLGLASLRQDRMAQERLYAYQRFMSFYAGRDRCLALSEATHQDNETLLNSLQFLGPPDVARLAEEHYLMCGSARADARAGQVPADWASRLDHSWTRFDRSRAQLMTRMTAHVPARYRGQFFGATDDETQAAVSAATRNR